MLGSRGVDRITTADVMRVLTPIWGYQADYRETGPATYLCGDGMGGSGGLPRRRPGRVVYKALPKTNGPRNHLASVPHRQAAYAVRRIRAAGGHRPARLATESVILTATRSG